MNTHDAQTYEMPQAAGATAHARAWSRLDAVPEADSPSRLITPGLADQSLSLPLRPATGDGLPSGLGRILANRRSWIRLRFGIDLAILCLVAALSLLEPLQQSPSASQGWVVVGYGLVTLVMLHLRRAPDDRLSASALDTFVNLVGISSLAAMITVSTDSAAGGGHPVGLAVRLWLYTVVYLGSARVVLMISRRQAMRRAELRTPTLIVGAGIIGAHLAHRLNSEPSYGLRPVGYLDANPLPQQPSVDGTVLPVLGDPEQVEEATRRTGARHVILSFSSGPDHMLVAVVRQCEKLGIGVSLVPRLYESINERTVLDHVGGVPLLTLNAVNPRGWQFAVKHAIDRSVAFLGLLCLAPLMLGAAAAVRLSSPGPVLFRQRRVGRDGREFDLLKFRTMRSGAVGQGSSVEFLLPDGLAPGGVEGIDRRTRVGRFLRDTSIDELPQLFNVLRGDMSLVGPRPERPEYVERFARDVARYDDRHRVRSGITGWAQVHGLRGQTSIADRVEWDNYYILNWSLALDLRIIVLTVMEILRFRG